MTGLCVCWAIWWELQGFGRFSPPAVLKRLRHSVRWLGLLVGEVQRSRNVRLEGRPGICLRVMDATAISEPGSLSTDWRVHLCLDLGTGCMTGIQLTDAHGAEVLTRFATKADEITVADRGYGHANGMGPVLAAGGQLVVRTSWQNLRLEGETGERVGVAEWLSRVRKTPGSGSWERLVWLPTPQGRFRLRLIAYRLPEDKAEAARRRARKASRKKGRTVDQRTLVAAGFVLVVSSLPVELWLPQDVLELYRIRWQVEIQIKRLKSVFLLDELRVQAPELAQAYLLGKLLRALLAEEMAQQVMTCHPDWLTDGQRPLNLWTLTQLCWQVLASMVRGHLSWAIAMATSRRLHRFLCDTPRKRHSQRWSAHALLHSKAAC